MKILAVTDISGYMKGGPVTAAAALLRGLVQRGHEVSFVSDRLYPGMDGVVHVEGGPHNLVEVVSRQLESFRPDIVHLLSMGQRGLLRLSGLMAGRLWVLTVHSLSPAERILRGFHGNDRLHYLLRNLRYLPNTIGWKAVLGRVRPPVAIVHSELMRNVAGRYLGTGSDVEVIELAAEVVQSATTASPQRMGTTSDAPRLLTVAGFAHTKGQHDALHAARLLLRRFPGLQWEFIGEIRDEGYFRYLQTLGRRLGLLESISFSVAASDEARTKALSSATLYVQPSHEEGFCLSLLEACGAVPRIAGTATGAIPEMIAGDDCARLVPPRHPVSLAAACAELLDQPVSESILRARQKRLAERFNWSGHVLRHEVVYQRLLALL